MATRKMTDDQLKEKLIEMLKKKNITLSTEQAEKVMKFLRLLSDIVVENYLLELRKPKKPDVE